MLRAPMTISMFRVLALHGSGARGATARSLGRCLMCLLTFLLVPDVVLATDLTLTWDPPAGPAPAGYLVRYMDWPAGTTVEHDAHRTTTATIVGLSPGRTYEFHVVAYDEARRVSGPSNVLRLMIPGPSAPFTTDAFPWVTTVDSGRAATAGAGGPGVLFLAEGASSPLFSTRLGFANPSSRPIEATMYLRPDTGRSHGVRVPLPPLSHVDADAATVLGQATGAFGVGVTTPGPLGVSRTTTWDGGRGGHAELATDTVSSRWYFAEGATKGRFELFYLVFNPGNTDVTVSVTYLLPEGPPIVRRHLVAAGARLTIWADHEAPELAATDVGAIVESVGGEPIVAERAMYLSSAHGFDGGHVTLGVPAPRTHWFMAEGATGPFFSLYILLANPTTTPAEVALGFRRPDGVLVQQSVVVAPSSRTTVNVAELDARLSDTAVWTEIASTNGVPIVAERVMWWPGTNWSDGHVSSAATRLAGRWLATGGHTGGARQHATYVLVANAGLTPQDARVTVLGRYGPMASTLVQVPASSRYNIDMTAMFPDVRGSYSVLVESIGGDGRLVVEQAVYWDAAGQRWAAGTATPGLPLDE